MTPSPDPLMLQFFPPDTVMKRAALILLSVYLGLALACGARRPPEKFHQKLVILGFDGLDPDLVKNMDGQG